MLLFPYALDFSAKNYSTGEVKKMMNIFAVMHRLMSSRNVTIQIDGVPVSEILAAAKNEEGEILRQAQEVGACAVR